MAKQFSSLFMKNLTYIFFFSLRCPTCGKFFVAKSQLKSHIQVVHEGQSCNICPQCGKSYELKKGLDRHMQVRTCNMSFNRVCQLMIV